MTGGSILTSERLGLRELNHADRPALKSILQDPQAMAAYEGAFSDAEVDQWLNRALERYQSDGFGLWAAVSRESGEMIGQCGLTLQDQAGVQVYEVGYLFNRAYWHQGLATESARAVRDYAFTSAGVTDLYAHVRDTNTASMNVAIRLGMTVRSRFVKHYRGVDMPHLAFRLTRDQWKELP